MTIVWRRDGERFHKDCVKPRKGAKQAGGVHLKFFVAMCAGRIVGCWDSEPYRQFSQTAKGCLDANSYAKWLEDLNAAVRPALGVSRYKSVVLLHDNWSVHTGPAARAALDALFFRVVEHPALSPDLNPIENIFSALRRLLDKIYLRPSKQKVGQEEFVADVRDVLDRLGMDGSVQRITGRLPQRFAAVVAAEGGPTKY